MQTQHIVKLMNLKTNVLSIEMLRVGMIQNLSAMCITNQSIILCSQIAAPAPRCSLCVNYLRTLLGYILMVRWESVVLLILQDLGGLSEDTVYMEVDVRCWSDQSEE
jgi:hypothetical protein